MTVSPKIKFLYTNIGRGHPFYLDGIREVMDTNPELYPATESTDVFALSSGLSRQAWWLVREMYRRGSSGGPVGLVYEWLRRGKTYDRDNDSVLRLLGRDMRRNQGLGDSRVVVAHPILVAILSDRPHLFFQHGELIAPREAIVLGAERVFVPIERVAVTFVEAGCEPERIVTTGLCIEPGLVEKAEQAQTARLNRIASDEPLSGLFLSSGAESAEHLRRIILSVTSCLEAGGNAAILAREGGLLHSTARRKLARFQPAVVTSGDEVTDGVVADKPCRLFLYRSRADENRVAAKLLGSIDYLVGPPHERSNWAIGLGLPMFALTPTIGPYASLNLSFLLNSGTARAIVSRREAACLGERLALLRRTGLLREMSVRGWGRYPIDGFRSIASSLAADDHDASL